MPSKTARADATVADAARELGVSPKTVRRHSARTEDPLPSYRIGSSLRFDLDEVRDWARRQAVEQRAAS